MGIVQLKGHIPFPRGDVNEKCKNTLMSLDPSKLGTKHFKKKRTIQFSERRQ